MLFLCLILADFLHALNVMDSRDRDIQTNSYCIHSQLGERPIRIDIDYSAGIWAGGRISKRQEDRVHYGINGDKKAGASAKLSLHGTQFGSLVCDGEGGDSVVKQLVDPTTGLLPTIFQCPEKSLVELFEEYDQGNFSLSDYDLVGSTAALTFVRNGVLHIAHCGDSRVVVFDASGRIAYETKAHKPDQDNPEEIKRITNAGASLVAGEVNGRLSVSRSFGHTGYINECTCEKIIIPTPEINEIPLEVNKEYFVVQFSNGAVKCLSDDDGNPARLNSGINFFTNTQLINIIVAWLSQGVAMKSIVTILMSNIGKFKFRENQTQVNLDNIDINCDYCHKGGVYDNVSLVLYKIQTKLDEGSDLFGQTSPSLVPPLVSVKDREQNITEGTFKSKNPKPKDDNIFQKLWKYKPVQYCLYVTGVSCVVTCLFKLLRAVRLV